MKKKKKEVGRGFRVKHFAAMLNGLESQAWL